MTHLLALCDQPPLEAFPSEPPRKSLECRAPLVPPSILGIEPAFPVVFPRCHRALQALDASVEVVIDALQAA